ncbi:MAG: histidine phosphatase family protein [Pseudomonadota bacterium]
MGLTSRSAPPRQMPGGPVRLDFPVYFIRHGETDWNAARRYQGHTDIPLNERGRWQAAQNGRSLMRDLSRPETPAFLASPLGRTRETMEIIRTELGLPAEEYGIDERLIEINLGDWEGRTPTDIRRDDPASARARHADKWGYAAPGGESYAEAAPRIRRFLGDLDRPSVIVGHGATGRLLRGFLRNLRPARVPHLTAPQNIVLKLERGREQVL